MPAPKYDWDKWFKQKKFRLEFPTDYSCSQSSICQAARNAATSRGQKVHIEDQGAAIEVAVKGGA